MKPSLRRSAAPTKLAEARASYVTLPADAIEAARQVCDQYAGGAHRGGGIPAVAARLGMKVGVLYNKLNPAEESYNRLTVTDFVLIFLATGRIEHLQALARTMNCVAFPVPDLSRCSDDALLDHFNKAQEEAGQYHGLFRHHFADGEIDAGELAELEKELFEWLGAIIELHNRVKGLERV